MLSFKAKVAKDKRTPATTTMQHRHFVMIASIIAGLPDHAPSLRAAKASTANQFAAQLAATNPAFDRDRFMQACQVSERPYREEA
jgi:hypothetical protein